MLCFRIIFWGVVLIAWLIPAMFFFGIVGRLAGFRKGPPVSGSEKAFGWIGIIILGSIMVGLCVGAGLIDWAVADFASRLPNDDFINLQPQPQPFQQPAVLIQPTPKPIRPEWTDEKMEVSFLSDMQEQNVRVGWGTFGKQGKLGYFVHNNDLVKVDAKHFEHAISMHPPNFGHSTVQYRLKRAYKLFRADAALGDVEQPHFRAESTARFHVLGDGQLLWLSDPLQQNGSKQHCRVSVEDVDVLELQIHCPGTHGHVRGVWLDPYVLK
jgi:hypothetical protein